ncbi:hypothetical protein REPUB_Repub02eG0171200 [Reevesia pubescens]
MDILMHQGEDEDLSVIPIVGIGGLAKTTVAKMVYNDERMNSHFDLNMWNVCQQTSMLLNSRGISAIWPQDKKYLLILDDVWNDSRAKWMELRDLLIGSAKGSKIIVTTRSPLVATIMGTVPAHNLPGLRQEDCLYLFLKRAFSGGKEKQHPNLVEIGRDIVQKCGAVPLAVSSLGNLLYSTTDEREWLSIRDNDMWKLKHRDNDILSVLKLSYDIMEPYLKQCFAVCSLFPKNYVFYSFEMIQF